MGEYAERINQHLLAGRSAYLALVADIGLQAQIEQAVHVIMTAFKSGHRLYIAGNGGSAADAQHFAAELVGWYNKKDAALPAIALTTDTSFLTAWGNDEEFEN